MIDNELRDAVHELHEYLADRLAPLMVADAMEVLLLQPPALLAQEIGSWAGQQSVDASASDLLFHCVKKIALMGEFDLVPRDRLAAFLRELSTAVVPFAPEAERALLRQNLDRLSIGTVVPSSSASVEVLHRPTASATPAAPAKQDALLSRAMTAGLRRLNLFLERLQRPQLSAAATPEQRSQVVSQAVTAAAVEARNQEELDEHLAPLRQLGIDPSSGDVFRTLAQTMAGWGALPALEGAAERPVSELTAMRQLVALAGESAEGARRFHELVQAAVEQFNAGNLGRAAQMIELAERLAVERRVKDTAVEPARRLSTGLDAERLRRFAERPDCRASLRTVLGFFTALRPEGLLAALDGEPNRDRRRQLLALVEVHGVTARAAARALLQAYVEGKAQMDAYAPMNLVYLLRSIPRPDDVSLEEEIQLVTRAPGRSSPTPIVKQVIAYLSFTRHDKAERALVTFLRVFETMLLQPESSAYPAPEVEILLDRTCVALARYGTPRAWKALVDHGLNAEARLGATLKRLAEAGKSQNLAASPEIVGRLITALQAELPRGVLGFKRRNDERVTFLIQALSGTPTPGVMQALQDLADRYSGQKIGEEAGRALAALKATAKPAEQGAAGLSGNLELFGLPDVLQTLSNSQVTGVLTLLSEHGVAEASVVFDQGLFRGARYKAIEGPEAVYQLFERPFRGTFAFVSRSIVGESVADPRPVIDLILEGVRRHDELKVAAALVPDDAVLATTGAPWTSLADENPQFAAQVWETISAGIPPLTCESHWAADTYRIRRLIAHWVEEGALKLGA